VTKKFKSHRESPQQGQFWKKNNVASNNRLYNIGKEKSTLTSAFALKKLR